MSKKHNPNRATHRPSRPADTAEQLEQQGPEAALDHLDRLDTRVSALILENLGDDLAADLLSELPPIEATQTLAATAPAEAADVVALLSDEARDGLLAHTDDQKARAIRDRVEALAYFLLRLCGDPEPMGWLGRADIAATQEYGTGRPRAHPQPLLSPWR